MIKFTIFLPTFNRHLLVCKTIESLVQQTYKCFEVLIYDNGSDPPVLENLCEPEDSRFTLIRQNENLNINDLGEDAIDRMSGSHFLFLADDDVLTPDALRLAADVLLNADTEMLQLGVTSFNHIDRIAYPDALKLRQFSGQLMVYNANEVAQHFISGWGIGKKVYFPYPRTCHPSGIFISRQLIDRVRGKQSELFIKPFGDIGYVGALLNTRYYLYVDLPLVIIGETPIREMNGAKPGQRQKWLKEVQYLMHSPLKAETFINMGMDAHLKVVFRNRLDSVLDVRLRPDFFRRHLRHVFSDSPWTDSTFAALFEGLPYLIRSWFIFLDDRINGLLAPNRSHPELSSLFTTVVLNEDLPHSIEFSDINSFAAWLQDAFQVGVISFKECQHATINARTTGAVGA